MRLFFTDLVKPSLFLLSAVLMSFVVWAEPNGEINTDVNTEMNTVASSDTNTSQDSLEARIIHLENKLAAIDKHELKSSDRITMGGFGSFSLTRMTEDAFGPNDESDHWSVSPHSIMGVHLLASITDTTRARVQVVAEGNEDFELGVEWLYLEQDLLPYVSMRMGRFGFAAMAESVNAKVGYTYPTVFMSDEVYIRQSIESVDGVSFDFNFESLGWANLFSVYYGDRHMEQRFTSVSSEIEGLYGFFLESSRENWDIRLAWYHAQKSRFYINSGLSSSSCTIDNYCLDMENRQASVAATYTYGDWRFAYELSDLHSENKIVGDIMAQTFLVARRINNFQPYIQWAIYDADIENDYRFEWNDRYQESIVLGLRHDILDYVTMKYQAKYVYEMDGTYGLFNYYSRDPVDFEDVWILDISLQFVFDDLL